MEVEAEMRCMTLLQELLQNETSMVFLTQLPVIAYFFYLDQTTLDEEILDIRETMKQKVVELEQLEGGDGSKSRAFQLKGMSK